MTARSPRGGRRDFSATAFDGDSAWDAYMMRDALVNDLLHCADESSAPVFANWIAAKTSLTGQVQAMPGFSLGSNSWGPIVTLGPFSLPVFADSTSYALRVRLYGAVTSGTADFAIQIAATQDVLSDDFVTSTGQGLSFTSATTSSTPALVGSGLIVPTSTLVSDPALRSTYATLDDAAGTPCTATVFAFYARIWARVLGKGAQNAQLYGYHLAAFVGA